MMIILQNIALKLDEIFTVHQKPTKITALKLGGK